MRKIIKICLYILTCFQCISCDYNMPDEEEISFMYTLNDNREAILDIRACPSGLESLRIPSQIDGYPVVELAFGFAAFLPFSEIYIPDGIVKIGDYAFNSCENLNSIVIPDSVTVIGDNVFEACENLEEVNLSANLMSLGKSSFYKCSSLSEIEIPGNITILTSGLFSGCSNLNTVILNEGLTAIHLGSFRNCVTLNKLIIPASTETIHSSAFEYCTNLSVLTSLATSPPEILYGDLFGNILDNSGIKIINVPSESVLLYKGAEYWIEYESIITRNDKSLPE